MPRRGPGSEQPADGPDCDLCRPPGNDARERAPTARSELWMESREVWVTSHAPLPRLYTKGDASFLC